VQQRTQTHGPLRMTDGRMPVFASYDAGGPADPADPAIRATRDNVFGHHGLTP